MRIFLAGDHVTGTGPANVTQYYIKNLPKGTLYQKRRSKPARAVEILIDTVRADVVVYSGYSKQNILGLKLAKTLKKPSAYIMHGCVEYENSINLEPDEEMNKVERRTLELADLVIAVSRTFCEWLKEYYPEHAGKFDYVTNGIDTDLMHNAVKRSERRRHMILSVGGGMPRKKIRYICEAVYKLRAGYDPDMFLCVIGAKGADSDKIAEYDFVDDRGIVSFEEGLRLFDEAAVFVQNSCFETFGLAPIEALMRGCPILCSKHVGALELIKDLHDEDVINDHEDAGEIASKIRNVIEDSNAARLSSDLEWESNSWKSRSKALTSKLSKLVLQK
ncbi:MAG: glycosyltransferase family 4 protein [Lachnospiraceae bacterium]|nr:glycosyltransferase family 4 protein [Lachnospiraceae bacterium]